MCSSCDNRLQVEDGHDLCPKCLGVGHLREALTDPCMNCGILPLGVREARLREVENLLFQPDAPPSGVPLPVGKKRKPNRTTPKRKRAVESMATAPHRQEMEDLRAEVERLKAMVARPAPVVPLHQEDWGEDYEAVEADAMSIGASNTMFRDGTDGSGQGPSGRGSFPYTSSRSVSRQVQDGSEASHRSSGSSEGGPSELRTTLQMALAKLGLDDTPATHTVANPFFRRNRPAPPFTVPPSVPFLGELKSCWGDPRAKPVRRGRDARTLASMQNAGEHGLDSMPPVDQCVKDLVLTPDAAMAADPTCPSTQCHITDVLLKKAYETAGTMSRLGNTLSVLLLAQSKIIEGGQPGTELADVNDVALETFALMTGELGRVMSTLVVARRQVWLAQAKVTDTVRKSLRGLPVVPGLLFGPEAESKLASRQQSQQASAGWGRPSGATRGHASRFRATGRSGLHRSVSMGGQQQRQSGRYGQAAVDRYFDSTEGWPSHQPSRGRGRGHPRYQRPPKTKPPRRA